jgi:hypothetical protein
MALERRASAVTAILGTGAALGAIVLATPTPTPTAHRSGSPAATAGSARLPNRVQAGTGGGPAVCVQLPSKNFECSWANQVNPRQLLTPSGAG